jgi:hypothetical protein
VQAVSATHPRWIGSQISPAAQSPLLVQPLAEVQLPNAHCSPAPQSASPEHKGGRQTPPEQLHVAGQSTPIAQLSGGAVQTPRSQANPVAQSASTAQSENTAHRPASQK